MPIGEQDSTGHDIGSRTSKSSSLSEEPGSMAHFISSLRLMPRRKKCPRMNKGNPNCQDILVVLGRPKSQKGKAPRL